MLANARRPTRSTAAALRGSAGWMYGRGGSGSRYREQMMDYPPALAAVLRRLDIRAREGAVVILPYDKFLALIRTFLAFAPVDEEWYKATYPDAAQGVEKGIFPSAREHYIQHGYFESRLPHAVEVDEAWYYRAYPDVESDFKSGGPSATQHYLDHGYREGRLPVPPPPPVAATDAARPAEETP